MKKLLTNSPIRLRAIEPEDLDTLYEWENDTELWKYGASIAPFSRFAIKEYLINSQQDIYTNKQLRLMIELQTEAKAVGTVDLYDFDPFHRRAGVGILIDKNYRHQNLGLQALHLLQEYAFGFLKLHQLYAFIPTDNKNSLSLFAKADYRETSVLKDWLAINSSFTDVTVMQKINPDF